MFSTSLDKMSNTEKLRYYQEHPDKYNIIESKDCYYEDEMPECYDVYDKETNELIEHIEVWD